MQCGGVALNLLTFAPTLVVGDHLNQMVVLVQHLQKRVSLTGNGDMRCYSPAGCSPDWAAADVFSAEVQMRGTW